MRRLATRTPANTPLLMTAVGIGALVAYALSSGRRRAALRAAGRSALDTGSRLVAASAERLRPSQPAHGGPLEESLEESTARQPQTFRDEANVEKVVEIGADKTAAPIHGIDAPERPGR